MELDEKQKAVRKIKNRLRKLFSENLDKPTLDAFADLLDNIAFMSFSLSELREEILKTGYIEHYDNGGGQTGTKDSAAVRTYNNTIKSYNTLVKTALSLLPESERKDTKDKLAEFLMKGK